VTGYGFRHLASTPLNKHGHNRGAIEAQLAHLDGSTRGVYNKAKYIGERRLLMGYGNNLIAEQRFNKGYDN
jgi:integrase